MRTLALFGLVGALVAGVFVLTGRGAARPDARTDRDYDGLDDRVEQELATVFLPVLHEYRADGEREECPAPDPRPILFRARPAALAAARQLVAITYVLLYAEDCGALGHRGDSEAFTLLLFRDPPREWRVGGVVAIAHQDTNAERQSIGPGREVWISRNKHANYATFDACADNDVANDRCARRGPRPRVVLLNAGEPGQPLARDLGELWPPASGVRIWEHDRLFEGGDVTKQLFLPDAITFASGLIWPGEEAPAPLREVQP